MLLLHHNCYDIGGGIIEGCNLKGLEGVHGDVLWGLLPSYISHYTTSIIPNLRGNL
jgi:hypothetical protein